MTPRSRVGRWWRIAAASLLVLTLMIRFSPVATATGSVVVVVTDEAGTPLAGVEVSLFGAVEAPEDTDGTGAATGEVAGESLPDDGTGVLDGALVPGSSPVVDPVVTGADGTATFVAVPEEVPLFVVQTASPDGYEPSGGPVPLTIAAAEAAIPIRIDLVAQVSAGVVEAIVLSAADGSPIPGTTVAVYTLPDPASGQRGSSVVEAITGPAGITQFDLPAGAYIVALTGAPAGFVAPGPAADQRVTVAMASAGQRDYHALFFEMQPGEAPPPIPTTDLVPPVDTTAAGDPAETPVPVTESPAATTPTMPVETPAATGGPTTASDVEPVTLTITGLVCADAFQFNRSAYYRVLDEMPFDPALGDPPVGCRLAAADEVTFEVTDPGGDDPFDDQVIARGQTGADGRAILTVPVPEAGRALFAGQGERLALSDPFTVVPGERVSLVAVNYVLPSFGNLVVRSLDGETGAVVAGGCYALVSADGPVAPFETCDAADDSTDGRTRFIDVPNGTYTVRQVAAAPGYAPARDRTVEVAGRSVETSVPVDALGAIEIWALACEGWEGPPELVVGDPSRRAANGDGTDVSPVDSTPVAAGCAGVAAELVIVPAEGPGASPRMTVRTGDDGRAVAVPVVPVVAPGEPHRVQLPDGSLVAEVDVLPGAITSVTLILPTAAAT